MSFWFINATARAAWAAATSQQGQLEGLRDLWSGQMSVRYYSVADAHLATVTHATPTIDTGSTPRAMVLGAWSAESHINPGTAAYAILAVPSGADILRADVTMDAPDPTVRDPGGRVRLDIGTRLRVQATAGLPTTDLPTWLAGRAVNEAFAVSGTVHAGSPAAPGEIAEIYNQSTRRLSYSNIGKDDGTRIIIACGGGHGDSSNNAVTSIDVRADTPTWALNKPNYSAPVADVCYYAEREPTSRHLYNTAQWSTTLNRLMLHTSPIAYGSGQIGCLATNGFNMATGLFDPIGTYANGVTGALCRDTSDFAWGRAGNNGTELWKWNPATDTWTQTGAFTNGIPKQLAHDSVRDQLFGLSWGNGGGSGTGRNAYVYRSGGTTESAITLNPVGGSIYPAGDAAQQFNADAVAMWPTTTGSLVGGTDCAMDHDPITDRFYWMDGLSGRIYYIVPNSGTTWDFGILPLTGATIPAHDYSHARMKVFNISGTPVAVFMPSGYQPLYAVRLA